MISISVEGLEEAKEILEYLRAMGNCWEAAEVEGRQRKELSLTGTRYAHKKHNYNNAQVLEWLGEGGRDFWSMDEKELDYVLDVFYKELIRGVKRWTEFTTKASKRTVARTIGRGLKSGTWAGFGSAVVSEIDKRAKQIVGNSLRKAALYYLKWISNNIEQQKWKGPAGDLSRLYKIVKQRKHGFLYPIGVATGQVLDNVAPSTKNIKLIRNQ